MKIIRTVFVCLFLGAVVIPLTFLDRNSFMSILERRVLANPPRAFDAGQLNIDLLKSLPRQIDMYVTDRFAFRSRLIVLMNNINFFVLHKSHDNKMLVGKDRWLFYIDKSLGDEFANFKKSNLFNKAQMQIFLEHFTLVNNFCRKNGIEFIFLIVPDKATVYPEKYPFPRPGGLSLVEQIINALPEDQRNKIIFPLDYLIAMKKESKYPLYYNNGLHWTRAAAYSTFELLYRKLKAAFPGLPVLEFVFTPYMDKGEDNYAELWGLKKFGEFMELVNVEPFDGWGSHYRYILSEDVPLYDYNRPEAVAALKGKYGMITENANNNLPAAVVIRDSYFVSLEPFVSSIFSKVEYIWTQPQKRNLEYLEQLPQKPDVFIWEIGERGLEAIPLVRPGEFPYD